MENKYPENYFEHYIVCFSSTGQTPDEAGFEQLASVYIEIEGLDTFSKLINEIQLVSANNDWTYFESVAKDFEIEDLDAIKLKEMAEIAINIFNKI